MSLTVRIARPVYSVYAYGALGDGSTDDTKAIQRGLNAMSGQTIEFPPGAYMVSGLSVPAGTRLVGLAGGGGALLRQVVLDEDDGSPILTLDGDGVTIDGIAFDGQASSQTADGFSDSFNGGAGGLGRSYRAAIVASGRDNIRVRDCSFTGAYGACVALKDASHVLVSGCEADTCYFELYFHSGTAEVDHRIVGNSATSIASGHASINANAFITSGVDGFVFEGNTGMSFERNLLKAESITNASISGNVGKTNSVAQFAGIQLQSDCANVSILGNALDACDVGIAINTDTVDNVTISNNTIRDCDYDGIRLGTQENHSGINIVGNTMSTIDRHGIYAAGGMSNSRIANNLMVSTAGAGCGIRVTVIDADSDRLTIASNTLIGFYGSTGNVGSLQLKQTGSGVYTDLFINGNQVFTGDDTRKALNASDATDYISTGYITDNYFEGTTNGDHSGGSAVRTRNVVTGTDSFLPAET